MLIVQSIERNSPCSHVPFEDAMHPPARAEIGRRKDKDKIPAVTQTLGHSSGRVKRDFRYSTNRPNLNSSTRIQNKCWTMPPRITIDLTLDDSDGENVLPRIDTPSTKSICPKSSANPAVPAVARAPLRPVHHMNIDQTPLGEQRVGDHSDLLLKWAIERMKEDNLRMLLTRVCRESQFARTLIKDAVLVTSDMVRPYHADSDSEDRGVSESESEDSSEEEDDEADEADEDDEVLGHMGKLVHRGVPEMTDAGVGEIIVDESAEVWYKYDEDARGPREDQIDNPDYCVGFVWSCCQAVAEDDDEEECDANIKPPKQPSEKSLKRKREEDDLIAKQSLYVSKYAECENCNEEFDVTMNFRSSCTWHPGLLL